jgi:hypothetical protein
LPLPAVITLFRSEVLPAGPETVEFVCTVVDAVGFVCTEVVVVELPELLPAFPTTALLISAYAVTPDMLIIITAVMPAAISLAKFLFIKYYLPLCLNLFRILHDTKF